MPVVRSLRWEEAASMPEGERTLSGPYQTVRKQMLSVNFLPRPAAGWANAAPFARMAVLPGITMTQQHPPVRLRPVRETDLDAVLAIQAACYPPAMQEGAPVVLARIRAAGDTSLVAESEGQVCAYVFAYRSTRGAVTPLDAPFAVDADGDTLYIHDLSVAPDAGGRGLARRLVEQLRGHARAAGLAYCALVSVQSSQAFWERLGLREAACGGKAARLALASYPPVALYMCGPA